MVTAVCCGCQVEYSWLESMADLSEEQQIHLVYMCRASHVGIFGIMDDHTEWQNL